MNPFAYASALATAWADGGQALLKANEEAFSAFAAGKWPPVATEHAADLQPAAQALLALWTEATSQFAALSSRMPAAPDNATVTATFQHMLDPRGWLAGGELDEMLARMAQGPRFADLWDMERRFAQVTKCWLEMRRCGFEHSAVVLQAWMRAAARFAETAGASDGAADTAPDSRAWMTAWTDIANAELLETQRSAPFLTTQSAMIRASTELRLAQQEVVEHIGTQYGLPTRTELDDVHRSVTELRREVRALRRQAREAPHAEPAPSAATRNGAAVRQARPLRTQRPAAGAPT